MMRRFGSPGTSLVLSLTLGGCAGGLPLGPDVVVSGAKYVAVQGEADLVARTFVIDAAGQKLEVAGAVCDVESSLYSARLTTPARLRVPNFGPQSPALGFSCAAGELKGGATVGIETYWRTAPGMYGPYWEAYGPGALGWPGPGWGLYGPSYPVSEYPNVHVILR